ncbi:MAG: DNA topoisomerase IV, partial [Sulfurimonas sp.]|nr:DNA topoisomerase IV [Sulfurimonas sp.]
MKILLINNNPVVNKLVTLSVQKTSDELDKAESIEDVESTSYNLLILDDGLYTEEFLDELKSKVDFGKSLYICAKDAKTVEGFDATMRKPFLPTDLVEMLVSLAKGIDVSGEEKVHKSKAVEAHDDFAFGSDLDDLDELGELDELESLDTLDEVELDELDDAEIEDGLEDFDDAHDEELDEDLEGEFDELEDELDE